MSSTQKNTQPNTQPAIPRRKAAETRQLVFEACSDILKRDGLTQLTLEAVADEAGLSKGGLLYHFPSKLALIEALVRNYNAQFDQRVEELLASDPAAEGNYLRAYAQASIEEVSNPDNVGFFASLFAAGERYPSVLDIMRQSYGKWQTRVEGTGLDPAAAMLVRLAVDGFWFTHIYQYAPPTGEKAAEVVDRILQLTADLS